MRVSRRIGIGVIGCGTIARWTHLRTLAALSGVRVVGFADPDPKALAAVRRMVDAAVYSSAEDLLARSEVDAVLIASPTALHARHAVAACLAGKHVYLEKPLAHDAKSLRDVQRCAVSKGLVFAVGYNFRFHPVCQWTRRYLRSGSIGDVHAIASHFTEPLPAVPTPAWRRCRQQGGGALLDLGSHHVDLYRWMLGDEPEYFDAGLRSLQSEQDSAWLRASTRRGAALYGYFSLASGRSHRLSIHGSKAVLHLDLHSGTVCEERSRRLGYGVRRRPLMPLTSRFAWQIRKWVQPSHDPSHALALRAFVASVAQPEQLRGDLATAGDGIAAVQAILNAEAAAGVQGPPVSGTAKP